MTPADDSPHETRLSLETAAPSAEAGEGDPDAAPYVGQRFPTHDAAYEFYSGFARRCGFSIRRHRTEGKDGVGSGLTRRYFVCHRAGSAPAKPLAADDEDNGAGEVHRARNLPFTEKDVRNLIQSRKVEHDEDESVDLLRMCKNFKEKDPNFKCEFTKDANNHVENIAWTYADSVQSYELFGDAVVFDTTHRLSALDMVLGIWVGLNNYGRSFFFACVLLREENQISFAWALQVFLNFMNRKAPLTILTDQNVCLKEAIEKELPSTKHVLCKWLIEARLPSWFGANLGERYKDWKNEFDRLYNMDSTVAFDLGWNDMVNCYGLHGNEHIASLFASRNLWALPFLRGRFTSGLITSPAVSKSTNAFIQRFLSAQRHLANFIEQVSIIVTYKDQAGEQEMMRQSLQSISLKTASPIEGHAAAVLSPYAFSKLQDELVASAQYASLHLEGSIFLVRHHTKEAGDCSVTWNQREELISCCCQMFESSGILCRHALRVLTALNYFQIPDLYLPVRWRRTQPPPSNNLNGAPHHPEGVASERVGALQSMVSALVSEATKSHERMDLATQEVYLLLSRIKQQPVSMHVSGESVSRLQ
ncbi:unnamed protein product [Miscanthus lutarioriparius]|uniref:Protein FAR1-RELATED SEQUENCE n=1 Tax=Miscanthus lutarioriparius TaxID=422564 RepID=A0A811QV32_9POAL|nr:unnamed protein product [Miscanthus lutarioriparius]